jgi:hypothetical protein
MKKHYDRSCWRDEVTKETAYFYYFYLTVPYGEESDLQQF